MACLNASGAQVFSDNAKKRLIFITFIWKASIFAKRVKTAGISKGLTFLIKRFMVTTFLTMFKWTVNVFTSLDKREVMAFVKFWNKIVAIIKSFT